MKINQLLYILLAILFISATSTKRMEWVTETNHDFGLIEQGTPVSKVFQFKNISDTPLTIDNVRPSCGCTAPEWDFDMVVLPDSIGELKLEFNAKNTGPFYKSAKVYFNGQRKGEKLILEGEVMQP